MGLENSAESLVHWSSGLYHLHELVRDRWKPNLEYTDPEIHETRIDGSLVDKEVYF